MTFYNFKIQQKFFKLTKRRFIFSYMKVNLNFDVSSTSAIWI